MLTSTARNISIISLLIGFLFPFTSFIFTSSAQTDTSSIEPSLIVEPTNPGPNETVTVRLEYFLSDLDRANITWSRNGVVQERGLGIKTYTTRVGGLGQETRIGVSFTTQEGEFLSQQVTLRPVAIDLLWEANTYVPPLYKGKALPSPQSTVKVVALPVFVTSNGSRISNSQLFYKWSTNRGSLPEQSGQGKNIAFIQSDLLNDNLTVSVTVSSPGGSLVKTKNITIQSQEPEVVLYEEDPLRGPRYEQAFTNSLSLNESEISLRAEPFYFSNENIHFDVVYNWKQNNQTIEPHTNNERVITLRRNPGQNSLGGVSNLVIEVVNPTKIRQIAEKLLRISF